MKTVCKMPEWTLRLPRLLGAAVIAFATVAGLASPAQGQDARRDLARIRAQIQQELRARPEVRQALDEWHQARSDYAALKRAVTYELTRDSTYLGLRAQMWATEDELAALQRRYRNGVIPAAEVQRLAKAILEQRRQMTRLESEAIARHGDLLAAREAYVAAGRKLVELRREMGQLLRADPRFQRALDRVRSSGTRSGGGGGAAGTGQAGGRASRKP